MTVVNNRIAAAVARTVEHMPAVTKGTAHSFVRTMHANIVNELRGGAVAAASHDDAVRAIAAMGMPMKSAQTLEHQAHFALASAFNSRTERVPFVFEEWMRGMRQYPQSPAHFAELNKTIDRMGHLPDAPWTRAFPGLAERILPG